MEKDKYLVVYYDGNQSKVAIKSEPDELTSGPDTLITEASIWGFPEDYTIIAIISPADPIEDSVVWIDGEEQEFKH